MTDLTHSRPDRGCQGWRCRRGGHLHRRAEVYDTVARIATALAGAGGSLDTAGQHVFAAIATAVAGAGIDFTDQTAVSRSHLDCGGNRAGDCLPGVVDAVALAIASSNASLQAALHANSGDALLSAVAALQLETLQDHSPLVATDEAGR